MSYHKRFKAMKKALQDTNQTISQITGLSEDSIKNQTQPNKDFPKWLKYTIDVFERMSDGKKNNCS
tara:strand:+ start:322 stop:519 length:198 start_codon:yes stop_codon:yes gene_type:complete